MDLSSDIIPELSQNKPFIPGKAQAKAKAEADKPCIYQPQMECRPGELELCEKCPELSGKCWPPLVSNVFERIKGLAMMWLNQERKV
jgi:hypothetical protein